MAIPTFSFGREVYSDETSTVEVDGFTLTATIYHDDSHCAPWEAEDGHGPVSDWRSVGYRGHPAKSPGERPLCADRGSARFYDFAEACRIALREGWGTLDGRRENETDRAYAARAAEEDFKRLRRWCTDEWYYVGIAVTVERADVRLTGRYDHAVWGIESDCGSYLNEVAADLAEEAMSAAREKLAELAEI